MKKILIILIAFLATISTNVSYARTNGEILDMQQEEFKIQDFLKGAEEYKGELFEDIDVGNILEEAIKGKVDNSKIAKSFLKMFGKEVTNNLKTFGSILAIIIIHSILKSISESLENDGISKLVYYVQYILIVTIIMANFSDIVSLVKNTANDLVGFMNMLVPLLITLMLYTGSITTSAIIEPIILFAINFVGNIIQDRTVRI